MKSYWIKVMSYARRSSPPRRSSPKSASAANDVLEALRQVLRKIELLPEERAAAIHYQRMVCEMLGRSLGGILREIPSGSFARDTAITPLNDIDIIIVLDGERRAQLWDSAPERTLNAVAASIRDVFDFVEPDYQNRSVRIGFKHPGFPVDIVPAFDAGPQGLLEIPDNRAGRWIETVPEQVSQMSVELNQGNAYLLLPIVRLLKKCRDLWNVRLKSFHIEMMCYLAPPFKVPRIDCALAQTFHSLSMLIHEACPDPADPRVDMSSYLLHGQRHELSGLFDQAAHYAFDAIADTKNGNFRSAHNNWKRIFGDAYDREFWQV